MAVGKCYVTTPIYYSSGQVQLGNSYSTIACDVFARFNRQMGRDTFFLTGMDEHGQKIEEAAAKAKIAPLAFVDQIASDTQNLWKALLVSNDDFIRTTDERHVAIVQQIFERLLAQGDIYLGSYTGHYCVSCETFFTKTQLGENDICPDCGKPTKLVSEESYFLNLKKYADKLLAYIEKHPDFIQPISRKNEVVSFIQSGLEDLCVSRTSFQWGIPVLSNPKHVVYVWIDALSNYLTALGYASLDDTRYQNYWVNNTRIYHVVGKDILRFHAIYWPIMLMALGIPLHFKLIAHGWILNRDGKMSKSRGNAVYPMDLINRYGADATRYYLAKELPLGNDGLFSYERFVERYNNDLANDLGNLVSRTVAMVEKYCQGIVPSTGKIQFEVDADLRNCAQRAIAEAISEMDAFQLQNGITAIWNYIRRVNKYIDETAPWALAKNAGDKQTLDNVMYHLAESLRVIAILVNPVLVETAPRILQAIGVKNPCYQFDKLQFGAAFVDATVCKGPALFQRVDPEVEIKYFNEVQAIRNAPQEIKKESEKITEITIDEFTKVSFKVGEIIASKKHPNADKLLVSQIKIGQETRQIVSGIAAYYQPEQLIGKKVVVVTNLKPVKIRGVESYGMVLCASDTDSLELLEVKNILSGSTVR